MSDDVVFGLLYLFGFVGGVCLLFCLSDIIMTAIYICVPPFRRWFDRLCKEHADFEE